MDDRRADEKLPRFYDKILKGLKTKRLLHLRAGIRAYCDGAFNVLDGPTIQIVSIQDEVSCSFNDDAEEYGDRRS